MDKAPVAPSAKAGPDLTVINEHQVLVRTLHRYLLQFSVNRTTPFTLPSMPSEDSALLQKYIVHNQGIPADINSMLARYFSELAQQWAQRQEQEAWQAAQPWWRYASSRLLDILPISSLLPWVTVVLLLGLCVHFRSPAFALVAVIAIFVAMNYNYELHVFNVDRQLEADQLMPFECLPWDQWTWAQKLIGNFRTEDSIREKCNEYRRASSLKDAPLPHSNIIVQGFGRLLSILVGCLGDSTRLYIQRYVHKLSWLDLLLHLVVTIVLTFCGALIAYTCICSRVRRVTVRETVHAPLSRSQLRTALRDLSQRERQDLLGLPSRRRQQKAIMSTPFHPHVRRRGKSHRHVVNDAGDHGTSSSSSSMSNER